MAKVIDAVLRLKDDFSSTLKRVEGNLKTFEGRSKKIGDSFYRTSKGLNSMSKAFMPATLAIGAGVAASVKAYGEFDTALVGVAKTTDMSGKKLEEFTKQIVGMTREIPASAVEIANVAEAAGQLGIKDITNFTETMIKLGTATNMTSEQASNDLARLANITQMPEKNFERLGSTVVALGNNMATTESEIVEMGLRLAAAGKQVGFNENQIMALSSSLSSLGVQAEAGGTAMSMVMTKLNTAAKSGGQELQAFADVAGMTAEEFTSAWERAPEKALVSLVDGLAEASSSGQDLDQVLKGLGITGIRELDTMKRLAGSGTMLADSFELAKRSWRENTALAEEAEKAYKSFESSVRFLKNAMFEVGQVLAKHVLPYLSPMIDKITTMAYAFVDADEKTQKFVIGTMAMIASIGPVLKILSMLTGGVGKVFDYFGKIGKAMKGGETLFGAILTPGVKFVAIAALIAGAALLIYKNWDKIAPVLENLKEKFSGFGEAIRPYIDQMGEIFGPFVDQIKGWIQPVSEFIQNLIPQIQEFGGKFVEAVASIAEYLAPYVGELAVGLVEDITAIFQRIASFIEMIAPLIGIYIKGLIKYMTEVVDFAKNVFTGNWRGAWDNVKNIVKITIDTVISMWNLLKSKLSEILKPKVDLVYDTFKKGYEWVKDKWESLKSFLSNPIRGVVNIASSVARGIGENARGTDNWKGGLTWVGEEGPELVNLPRRSKVHTATSSRMMARDTERKEVTGNTYLNVAKIADSIIVREEADIDRIVEGLYRKLKIAKTNKVTV